MTPDKTVKIVKTVNTQTSRVNLRREVQAARALSLERLDGLKFQVPGLRGPGFSIQMRASERKPGEAASV